MNHQIIKRGMLAALMLFWVVVSVQGQIPTGDANSEESTLLLPFYLLSQQDDNGQLGPPLPFNPYPGLTATALDNGRGYVIDDVEVAVAKSLLSMVTMNSSEPPGLPPEGQADTNYYSGTNYHYNIYGSNGIWLELVIDANDPTLVDPILHGVTNGYWELFSKQDLSGPLGIGNWVPVEISQADGSTNALSFTPISLIGISQTFFRAVGGNTAISITPYVYSQNPVEPCTPSTNDLGTIGTFIVSASPPLDYDITVNYSISGSAINGTDYTNISGSVIVPSGNWGYVYIQPRYDTNIEFQESVTLTTVLTNGYLIEPTHPSGTMWISDCFSSNIFDIVSLNTTNPVGIDYLSQSNSLLISVNFNGGEPNSFDLLNSNGVLKAWSGIHGLPDEVKVATVKATANGLNAGDVYFGSDVNIGWLSANGASSNLIWCQLTNSVVTNALPIRGSLYVDQTGIWGGDLIAVTSIGNPVPGAKGVWRINSTGHPTLVANFETDHLEGVITLTNDVSRWGPWAGKIITGDEDKSTIYAVDTNGVITPYHLGIDPEDFDIIRTNQDLYCTSWGISTGAIVRLSSALLANYQGDLLVTEAGETGDNAAKLFIVHWDGSKFVVRRIVPKNPDNSKAHFEHVTFAPIHLPTISQ